MWGFHVNNVFSSRSGREKPEVERYGFQKLARAFVIGLTKPDIDIACEAYK